MSLLPFSCFNILQCTLMFGFQFWLPYDNLVLLALCKLYFQGFFSFYFVSTFSFALIFIFRCFDMIINVKMRKMCTRCSFYGCYPTDNSFICLYLIFLLCFLFAFFYTQTIFLPIFLIVLLAIVFLDNSQKFIDFYSQRKQSGACSS